MNDSIILEFWQIQYCVHIKTDLYVFDAVLYYIDYGHEDTLFLATYGERWVLLILNK